MSTLDIKATQAFIDYARGTCNSISETCDVLEIEDEDTIDWGMVDEQIFRCEGCSWWCELHEQDENGDCQDCSTIVECDTCYTTGEQDDMVGGTTCSDCYEEGGDI